jgi:DNA polymerase I
MGELARQVLARRRQTRLGILINQAGRNGQGSPASPTAPHADGIDEPAAKTSVPNPHAMTEVNDSLQSSTSPVETPPKTRPKKKPKTTIVEVGPTYDPGPYTYIKDVAELEKVLPSILEAPDLAIDIETTGLSHIRDRIRLVQLATPEQAILVDAFHVPVEMLAPILQGNRTLYGQNLKFDVKFLLRAGLPYPACPLKDAMLIAQILGADDEPPQKDRYTLTALAKKYLGLSLDKHWQKGPWDGELCDEQLRYAVIDAKIVFPLIAMLESEVPKANLEQIVDLEHRCLIPLCWLERAGMGVDADAWRGLAEKIMERKPILEDELAKLTLEYVQERKEKRRGEPINWRSPTQVLAVLHDRGIQVDTTATKILQAFSDDPVVERFLEWVPLDKRTSSFGENWVTEHFDPETGRVYPSFQQIGSRAGRMSCKEPNLQNIPKDIDYRGCFRAAEGYRLVGGDYSQIELRIMAFLTKEPALLDAFRRHEDVHRQTAAKLFNMSYDAVTPEQRARAKTINFGVIYGMGYKRLAAETGYTEDEAKAFLERYFKTYKKVNQYKHEQLSRARKEGEVRTILGRRRLLPRIHDRDDREWYTIKNMTINTPIQGSAADAFKLALGRLFEHRDEVPGVRLTNLIHDEIVCETPVEQVEPTKAWLERHMADAMREMVQDGVPIKVDMRDGQSWAECSLEGRITSESRTISCGF